MNDWRRRYNSRKLQFCFLGFVASSVLCWFGKLDGQQFVIALGVCLTNYTWGNKNDKQLDGTQP